MIKYAMGSFEDDSIIIRYVEYPNKSVAVVEINNLKNECSNYLNEEIQLIADEDFITIRLLDQKGSLFFMFAEVNDNFNEDSFINYLNNRYGDVAN